MRRRRCWRSAGSPTIRRCAAWVCRSRGTAFAHGAWHSLPDGRILAASFHTSRYNMNTGRLTEAMFDAVVARLAGALSQPDPRSVSA